MPNITGRETSCLRRETSPEQSLNVSSVHLHLDSQNISKLLEDFFWNIYETHESLMWLNWREWEDKYVFNGAIPLKVTPLYIFLWCLSLLYCGNYELMSFHVLQRNLNFNLIWCFARSHKAKLKIRKTYGWKWTV